MIFYSGLKSVNDIIVKRGDRNRFTFHPVDDPDDIGDLKDALVFLIGPGETNPVKLVQKVTARDKHLSIVILSHRNQHAKVRQALQFSPLVGKNTTCLAFNPEADYTQVFELAQSRTNQKRSFSRFRLTAPVLPALSSPSIKLENFGQALEHAPIGVFLLDRSGNVIGANQRSRQMFRQLDNHQISLAELFPEKSVAAIQQLIREGKEETIQTEGGQGYYYEISSAGFGSGKQTLLLINDITERKEKDGRLEAILESLPQMAWTATPEGRVNYYTQGWYQYTNQTPAQALNDGWTSIVHPEDRKLTTARWIEAVEGHKVYQHAARFRRFDGEYRWHLSRAVPVHSMKQNIFMWVGTSTDVHDQVLLAENLEQKVRERTRSLEAANAELEQFAYVSSHDLQEPLRKIHTFAELVKEYSYQSMDDLSRKYIDKIIATATRMSKLLKDLLNFTKLHHNEQAVPVNLGDIVAAIREDLELAISQNGAKFHVGDLPVIQGHPSQLKQLFYNLINNALKFRSPDCAPMIEIRSRYFPPGAIPPEWALPADEGYWQIMVRDNGIGFEQKYAEQIFTIFQRLHGHTAYEGTGIGLAISRKVVANHGGLIHAVSSPGQGAEFRIVLPAENNRSGSA